MGSIFCIGQSAYDITIPLDGAICENQKYRVTQKEECGGGPAFNAAYLCAMWGEKVELISRIGNDTYGKRLLEIAAQAGIGSNYLIKDDEIETPHSYIFSNQATKIRKSLLTPHTSFQSTRYNSALQPPVSISACWSVRHVPC